MEITYQRGDKPALLARRRSLFTRLHFWAALIASPFALLATVTGLIYVLTPQIESVLYAQLDRVEPAGKAISLDDAISTALASMPVGTRLLSAQPPFSPGDSVKVLLARPSFDSAVGAPVHDHGQFKAMPVQVTVAYVDPYRNKLLGSLVQDERFSNWARRLHSRLLQGEALRWMIELAASWLMVMLISGIYLWWPRGTRTAWPRKGRTGRAAWRQWHALLGVALSLITFVILTTGLTWSRFAGDQIRLLRDHAGQASPQAPRGLSSQPVAGAAPLDWQAAWDIARRLAPPVAMSLTAPRETDGTWRAASADPGRPASRFELQLDAYSGKPLYLAGWAQQTAFGKATGIGIPFHRGEFGWWNQAVLVVFGAGILFSLLSGWVMFFKRWRKGLPMMPRLLPGSWSSTGVAGALLALLLMFLMPLLALSSAGIAAVEWIMGRQRPRAA